MPKNYIIVAIGVAAILIAFFAVYEVSTINTQVQTTPEQTKIPDYSAQLGSLQSKVDSINSQIGSISKNLAVLNTLNSNITDIQRKLVDLQNKNTQTPQTTPSASLTIFLDKSSYLQSDTIKIVAVGANPQKTSQIQLLDNTGFVVLHKDVWSDSTGRVSYDLQLSSTLPLGNYKIQIISDQQTGVQPITIISSGTTTTTSSTGSQPFTAQTDKGVYNTGELIQVSGTGQPGTTLTGVMSSPTGKTYSTTTQIQSDGTYVIFFSTSQPYETGTWHITLTNLVQTKSISINIGSGGSTGTYTFTAQTDKSIYHRGDIIHVSGTGQLSTSVSGVLAGPSGQTYTSATNTNSDGTYTMLFSTSASYETGNWYVTATNLSQSKGLSISIQP
jgi:hypothetical protein